MNRLPLTPADLRAIANAVEAFEKAVTSEEALNYIERAELTCTDDRSVIWGHIVACDDWWGFLPTVKQ